ncbi:MAG: WbqC family protein [Candidatus Omnitrophota bacterium]|nr:WbqC family protein [Candidatus Omnitrophota bacterium]
MNKTVVIHQPDFLPHIGFFHRFLYADLWVILDNVQFIHKTSKSWHNRDKIKTPQGEKWITLPIKKCPRNTNIREVFLSTETNWRNDHLNLIKENYKKAPYFSAIFPRIEELYHFKCNKMINFNLKSINMLLKLFDIKISSTFASTLNSVGRKNELLVDILKKVGGSVYLSGLGAKSYFDQKPFDNANIKVVWQDFKHPVYPQLHGKFIPYLSSVDLLMNCGIEKSRKILKGGDN